MRRNRRRAAYGPKVCGATSRRPDAPRVCPCLPGVDPEPSEHEHCDVSSDRVICGSGVDRQIVRRNASMAGAVRDAQSARPRRNMVLRFGAGLEEPEQRDDRRPGRGPVVALARLKALPPLTSWLENRTRHRGAGASLGVA